MGRSQWSRGLRPLACCDRGFEFHQGMDVYLLGVLSGRGLYGIIVLVFVSLFLYCVFIVLVLCFIVLVLVLP
jgi:hypothetical protein